MVIETILSQSIKPDKVILYLSKVQFPRLEDDLPDSLLHMKASGLDIRFVEGDIRSHKKYYYVMQAYPVSYTHLDVYKRQNQNTNYNQNWKQED